jgi:hypothetical protein
MKAKPIVGTTGASQAFCKNQPSRNGDNTSEAASIIILASR